MAGGGGVVEERWAKVLGAPWEVACARRSHSGASGEGLESGKQSLTHPLAVFSCSHLIASSPQSERLEQVARPF